MRIELASFISGLSDNLKLNATVNIINDSISDLLLLPGHSIGFVNDIELLAGRITNSKTEVILELQDINSQKLNNCLYRVSNGAVKSMFTNQLFATSDEINGNYELAERLLNEFQTRRSFKIKGQTVLVLQCGELNILRNLQSQKNKVQIRIFEDKLLTKRFEDFFETIDIFLNPLHTPMGNQGKMHMRRVYLSKIKRKYFSTSNTSEYSPNLSLSGLQYAYHNGLQIFPDTIRTESDYVVKTYVVP